MFLISFLRYIESYFIEISTVLVFLLIIIYFSNYIRIFYYISKLPGPPAYPIIGNALLLLGNHKDVTQRFFKLFEDYESILRGWLGPMPLVGISNPDFIQELLNNKHSLEKGFLMKYLGKKPLGNSMLISEVSKWKHNRKIVARGFTPEILKSYFQIFIEKSLILTEKLNTKSRDAELFDISEYLSKLSLDSVCGSTMGVNINAQISKSSYYSAMESVISLSLNRVFNIWLLPSFIHSFTQNCEKLNDSMSTVKELTNNIILQKKRNFNNKINNNMKDSFENNVTNNFKKPLLEYLIDFTATNLDFTDEDLRDEATLVIMAGYETSPNALSYVLLNLAANKDIQNTVFEELYEVLGGDLSRPISLDDLSKLRYMEMVVKESMRLHSTVPLMLKQLTGDVKIGKYLLPKGISCFVSIFSLHRDEKIWENPLKFDPERFTSENSKNRHPYAYIPFSAGPRNCIGMRYAWMFMKTVLATLLSRYEFHTDLNIDELQFEFAISLKPLGGHQIRNSPRNTISLK